MLFKLIRDGKRNTFLPYMEKSASELDLTEKNLENWLAENPELLFGGEQVLVISQSVSGQRMADILALDGDGCVVIIEIKRDWSNRATVGQLLEYAAEMTGKKLWRSRNPAPKLLASTPRGQPIHILDRTVSNANRRPEC